MEQAHEAAAQRWAGRFADLLDEDPSVEAGLRAPVEEVAAQLPPGRCRRRIIRWPPGGM